MNLTEYMQVKDFTYLEYCNYLQNKYGIGLADYMTKGYNPNKKCKRTNEGLVVHHKKEDCAILLSKKEVAQHYPFEWQEKENLVYCDYLEHLLLHVLICKYTPKDKQNLGIGGVYLIATELNDLYSGWTTQQSWRIACHERVIADKEVYLLILKQFITVARHNTFFAMSKLCASFNQQFGLWDDSKNKKLYKEIKKLSKSLK